MQRPSLRLIQNPRWAGHERLPRDTILRTALSSVPSAVRAAGAASSSLVLTLAASFVLALAGGVGTADAGDLLAPPSGPTQSATQSNDGSNTADQSGASNVVVVSGPNIAIANGGDGKSSCSPCGSDGAVQ